MIVSLWPFAVNAPQNGIYSVSSWNGIHSVWPPVCASAGPAGARNGMNSVLPTPLLPGWLDTAILLLLSRSA